MISWFSMLATAQVKLDVQKCQFIGNPYIQHIYTEDDMVYIREITVFPGFLSPQKAIRWGLDSIIRDTKRRIRFFLYRINPIRTKKRLVLTCLTPVFAWLLYSKQLTLAL